MKKFWLFLSIVVLALLFACEIDKPVQHLETGMVEDFEIPENPPPDRAIPLPNRYGTVTYIGNIPNNKEVKYLSGMPTNGVTSDSAQGIACGVWSGRTIMFYASKTRVVGWDISRSHIFGLTESAYDRDHYWEIWNPYMDYDYKHFGDLDYQHNATADGHDLIYVPLERVGKVYPPLLLVYGIYDMDTMIYYGFQYMTAGGISTFTNEAPWVAVDPTDKRNIYTSEFDVYTSRGIDRYYDNDPGPGILLQYRERAPLVDQNNLHMAVTKIQGGEFNTMGDLFLAGHGPQGWGVYAFYKYYMQENNIWKMHFKLAAYIYAQIDPDPDEEEFEGITIGDISPIGYPEQRSQIHLMLVNFDFWSKDNLFFKHFRVQDRLNYFTMD